MRDDPSDRGGPRIRAFSAGIRPKPLHPDAAAVMRDRYRIDITDHPDPAAGEGGLAGYPAFERTAAELDTRIRFLLPALDGPVLDAA